MHAPQWRSSDACRRNRRIIGQTSGERYVTVVTYPNFSASVWHGDVTLKKEMHSMKNIKSLALNSGTTQTSWSLIKMYAFRFFFLKHYILLFFIQCCKASSRDLDASEYGFVFSTYKLAMLVGSQGAQKAVSVPRSYAK